MTRLDVSDIDELENEQAVISGRSYLVVDYGRSACKATLYDVVEGRYRMIGRGEGLNTAGPPWFDLSFGLQQAIGQIADATGRKLLTLQGQLIRPMRSDGSGVDYFGATVSLGEPLTVIIAGLMGSASIASARKALQAVYAREVACLSLDDGKGRPGQVDAIVSQQPDIIFFVGGTDGGADKQVRELLNTIALALEIQAESVRPIVIYGGNAALGSVVASELDSLTEVYLVDNVRPSFDEERLDHAIGMLAQIYYNRQVAGLTSSGVLADWSNATPLNSAHAFGGIAEYLATAGRGRVVGLDVGSGQVTLVAAVDGKVDLLVRSDLGLGQPLSNLMVAGQGGADGFEGPLADYVLDKSAHPGIIPLTSSAAKFELSLASRLIRQIVAQAAAAWRWPNGGFTPPFHTLLLRGRVFTNAGDSEAALRAVLDGLRARGVFRVLADNHGVLPAMGLLAAEDPDMVVQVLGGVDLVPWAWVVAPAGRARQGQTVMSVSMEAASGGAVQVDVAYGDLDVIPMQAGERYKVELKPATGVDVGAGAGHSRQVTIGASAIGLVVDCRDR